MTRTAAIKTYANFTGGLITEASELSYPENAAKDIDNMDINEDGSIQRRAGLAFDGSNNEEFPVGASNIQDLAMQVYRWDSVNGKEGLDIAVVQIKDVLYFYYTSDQEVLSQPAVNPASPLTLGAPLRTSASTLALRQSDKLSFTTAKGRLYVAGKYIDPYVVTFNEPATAGDVGTVTSERITIEIRDFEIVGEGEVVGAVTLDGSERQNYMSGAHFYNLANQGWPSEESATFLVEKSVPTADNANTDAPITDRDPAAYTYTALTTHFPTTADLFHTFQMGGGTTVTQQQAFSPYLLEQEFEGNSASPRGRIIQEAFYVFRRAVGNIGGRSGSPYTDNTTLDDIETSDFRPSAIAYYAGRMWYAGVEGVGFNNNLYYSQVLGNDAVKSGKCYQEADPTAEVINELVATDGGVLSLEEIGNIKTLIPIGTSLAVIADNGVWSISGDGEASSFRADSFSVRRITNQGSVNKDSIIFARDVIYYWGETSIIAIALDQTGFLVASDISSVKVKRKYLEILGESQNRVFTVFDKGANRVLWFYRDSGLDATFNAVNNKAYNKVLYWDISLQAYGQYTISIDPDTLIVSGINFDPETVLEIVDPILDGGVQVVDSGVDVVDTSFFFIPEASSLRLLTFDGATTAGRAFRFSRFSNVSTFDDWGNTFTSYVEAGFDSLQDIMGKGKQATTLQTLFRRTEDTFDTENDELVLQNQSGCLVSYGWDWATSPYSNPFQAYRLLRNYTPGDAGETFNYGVDVVTTRNRLRGRGTSLGLRFESDGDKDLQLLGYALLFSTRGRP